MDARELRRCFGRFATGVTVVTFQDESGPHGITVNSYTSVSLEPPLVLVSIDRKARSHDQLAGRNYVVNILAADQEALGWHFAGKPQEGLTVPWEQTEVGPRLAGAVAHVECKPWKAYDGGDHTLYVGEVVDFSYRGGDVLGFFGGKFFKVADPAASQN